MKRWWNSFVGTFRLVRGYCPSCNSDAPHIDTCRICDGYRRLNQRPPSERLRDVWWQRFDATDFKRAK